MCIENQECQYRQPNEQGVFVCVKRRHEFCPDDEESGDEDENGEDGDGVDELDFEKN